jgi:hypothetical protein
VIERTVIWQPWDDIGLEHLRLVESDNGAIADSLLIQVIDHQPIRLRYEIRVDAAWRVREANIDMLGPEFRQLKLRSNGSGRWTDATGGPLDSLEGCIDIDLIASPFTNTLPIRRIRLEPDEAEEISVVYIRVPELSATLARQRYTCLEKCDDGSRYLYEGLETEFKAELPVDSAGLVIDYPGLFRRMPLEHPRLNRL